MPFGPQSSQYLFSGSLPKILLTIGLFREENLDKEVCSIIVEITIMSTRAFKVENLSLGIIDGKTLKQRFDYQHGQ